MNAKPGLGSQLPKYRELIIQHALSDSWEIKVDSCVKDGISHMTKRGSFEIDVSLEGSIILCSFKHEDQPDMMIIEKVVGSILGQENVIINSKSVGRIAPSKQAIMAIGVEGQPSKETLKRIGEIPIIEEFVFLKM